MSYEILDRDEAGVVQARLSGVMTPADQHAFEALAKALIDAGGKIRLLVTLDGFAGWESGSGWGDDLDFQFEYGNEIVRIAVVGDERWEEQVLAYLGKGFRATEIEFFTPGSLPAAKAWIQAG